MTAGQSRAPRTGADAAAAATSADEGTPPSSAHPGGSVGRSGDRRHLQTGPSNWLLVPALSFFGVFALLPLAGVLGAGRLSALYGIAFEEPNLVLLMRHRAVLFGLLGVFLAIAALIGAHLYLVAKLGTTAPPWLRADKDEKLREERV